VAGDLRGFDELRRMFQIAAERLRPGALLVLNAHVAVDGYVPSAAALQWGQQCCASVFTKDEIERAGLGLALELTSDASAYDFERAKLPEAAWPPTEVYTEWALGQHMYALDREQCPIELRWLVFRKS
jgi:hypothetical protein